MKKIRKIIKRNCDGFGSTVLAELITVIFSATFWFIIGSFFAVSCSTSAKLQSVNLLFPTPTATLQDNSKDNDEITECNYSSYQPIKNTMAVPIKLIQPIYPKEAKEKNEGGRVCVKVLVNAEGNAEKACALDKDTANNCQSGVDSSLKRAAEAAAMESKFKFIPTFEKLKINPGYVEKTIAFNFVAAENEKENVISGTNSPKKNTKKKNRKKRSSF